MSKTVYRITILSVAFILLAIGTYIGFKIGDKATENNIVVQTVDEVEEPPITPVISNIENKNLDIEVIYEDYYIKCKETVVNKNMEFGTTLEKIKEKVDKDYVVVEEKENSILFRKEIDTNCPNHYELKLVDDYVMIYQRVNEEKSILYKNTEIPRSTIRDEIISELEKGIKVDNLDDLNSYIEDIES